MITLSTVPFDLVIEEFCRPENVFKIICRWYSSIREIKQHLNALTNISLARLHLFHSSKPLELNNNITLHDLGIETSGYSMKLAVDYVGGEKFTLEVVNNALVDDQCRRIINDVMVGLDCNRIPGKTDILDSTGGVYFLRSSKGANAAVFKPRDEEQGMENNPKGYSGKDGEYCLRPHFTPGHGCLREFAAYIFDVNNFCGVPPTTLIHCEHPVFNYPTQRNGTSGKPFPKFGSLQAYVHGESFEDIGPSKLTDFEVQKIALFDLRILNCDRNSGNILAVRKLMSSSRHGSDVGLTDENTDDEFDCFDTNLNVVGGIEFELVPIDHGYAFPPRLRISEADWSWFYYPQVSRPIVPEIKDYIASLDIDVVLGRLKEAVAELPEETVFLVRLAHLLIKLGVDSGLTLRDIAELVARLDEEEPSKLEQVISLAEDNAFANIQMKSGRARFCPAASSLIEAKQLSLASQTIIATGEVMERDRSDSSGSSDAEAMVPPRLDSAALPFQRLTSVFSLEDYPVAVPSPVTVAREVSEECGLMSRDSSTDSLSEAAAAVAAAITQASDTSPIRPTIEPHSHGKPSRMNRIASFAGFSSASIYDIGKNRENSESLQRERRKLIAKTNEFKLLKWKLASDAVQALIYRTIKKSP